MIARWDALLLAAVLSGGSMLIENSHRIDTGSADDTVATPSACVEPAADRSDTTNASDDASDARYVISAADDDAALPTCD